MEPLPHADVVVGRAAELRLLRERLDRAGDGAGSVVVLLGEAGIGKSRLLLEVKRWCDARGAAALVGRAVDGLATTPFRALAEALMGAYRGGSVLEDPDVAPFRRALARLVPDGDRPADPEAPVLHVAEGFLRVARRRGTAVLLDDLHWADAETLAVLEYLADNIAAEPVLVVAAARADPTEVLDGLTRLAERRVATLVHLARFGPEDAVAMTRECLGDPLVPAEVARLVVDRADGLPFFVEELLAGLQSDGTLVREDGGWIAHRPRGRAPATFRESIRQRVSGLDDEARAVVGDAALLGRWIEPALLIEITGATPAAVDATIADAVGRSLMEVHELGVRFRHALIRDALLADMAPFARAQRSREVLAALRSARPELPGDLVDVAAELAEGAGDPDAAADLLMGAGRRALTQGALTSAESALRRALALATGRAAEWDVRTALVETLGLAARFEDAFPIGERLLAHLGDDPSPDPGGVRRFAVHHALARAATAATDWSLARAHLDRAGECPGALTPTGEARLDALAAVVALGEYRAGDAAALASAAVAAAERGDDPDLLCEALLVHGRCLRTHDLAAADVVLERARAVAHDARLAHREARALTELGMVRMYRSDDATLHAARARAEACGAPETEALARHALSACAQMRGETDAALEHGDAALALARRFGLGQLVPAVLIMRAATLAVRGDTTGMEAVLAEAEPLAGDEANEVVAVFAQTRAMAAFATDDLEGATAHLAVAADRARRGAPTVLMPALFLHVLIRAVDGGDPRSEAAELAAWGDAGVAAWSDAGSPLLAGPVSAADAVDLGRRGRGAEATTVLEGALADLGPAPLMQAVVARLAAAAAERDGWGHPIRWWATAAAAFTGLGLTAPATACAPAPGPSRDGDLTGREAEVLGLVAGGLSNREIATRLVLSVRTVEKHVERLLAKTGSPNRTSLATRALRRHADT